MAQEGIEANIGAKKTETKNMNPVVMAVIPVFPPSVHNIESAAENFRKLRTKRTANTGGALDVSSDRTDAHKCAKADTDGINAIGYARALEVHRYGVTEASKFSHGI